VISTEFEQYLSVEKRYSAHTLTAYISDLQQFENFLAESYDISDILETTPSMIRTWMVELVQHDIDARSIRRKRSVLNSLFSYAIKQERLTINPMDKISVPKVKKKLPVHLRLKELDALKSLLPEMIDYQTAREHTIITLLFSTGIRRGELIGLKLSDIRLKESVMRVLGKRSKERLVPLAQHVQTVLRNYMSWRQQIDSSEMAMFLTDAARPLYPKFVYNLVKRYLKLVTNAEGTGPHTLRHTFATLMLDEGADINAIKELLGHADLNATQVYTHTSIEKLKAAYGKSHPRAK